MKLNVARQEYSAWNIHYRQHDYRSDHKSSVRMARFGVRSEIAREEAAWIRRDAAEVCGATEVPSEV